MSTTHSTATSTRKRIRAGYYQMEDATGATWTIREERVDAGYGGGWAWYATSDDGGYLDPLPTLRRATDAIASIETEPEG
jgi:hypothetical protein